jgi:NADPH:quinone reductase-like Zn-dependent oxidoreductase
MLVEVRAISLNRGEVRRLSARTEGTIPGWDVAGVVREADRAIAALTERSVAGKAVLTID